MGEFEAIARNGGFGAVILVLGYIIHQLLTGKLVPKWAYDDQRRQTDEAKTDAREWKSAALQGLGLLETKSKTE